MDGRHTNHSDDNFNNNNIVDRIDRIKSVIGTYPDFPQKGVLFRDFFPIFANPHTTEDLIYILVEHVKSLVVQPDAIVGLESRGFLVGLLMSSNLGLPFIPIRKKGKLPGAVESIAYQKEYGQDYFEISKSAFKPGMKCLLVDDLLATGGSLKAAEKLLARVGASVIDAVVLMELTDLNGRKNLDLVPVFSVIRY